MKKAVSFALKLVVAGSIWLLLLLNVIPLPFQETFNQILPALPFLALVSFGSYSLGSIGLSLLSFRDCPEAHASLQKEIIEAKQDLKAKGISIGN